MAVLRLACVTDTYSKLHAMTLRFPTTQGERQVARFAAHRGVRTTLHNEKQRFILQ
jgi:hypothetical protein